MITRNKKEDNAFFESERVGHQGANNDRGHGVIEAVRPKYIRTAWTGQSKVLSGKSPTKSANEHYKKDCGIGLRSDSIFMTNSGKYERDKSDPRNVTLTERDCSFPTRFAVAKDKRNSTFIVTRRKGWECKGSKVELRKNERTLDRSQAEGPTGQLGHSNSKECMRSQITKLVDNPGRQNLNTDDNTERYPLMEGIDRCWRTRKNDKKICDFNHRRSGNCMAMIYIPATINLPAMLI